MIQTTETGLTRDPEPAAVLWAEIPRLREILAGLIDVVSDEAPKITTSATNVGSLALDAVA